MKVGVVVDLAIPFNSMNGDRTYTADDIAQIFAAVMTNGVHPMPGDCLQVVEQDGFSIKILPGRCLINGRLGVNQDPKILTLASPVGSLPRIDSVVIRYDALARNMVEDVVPGAYAGSPTPPALTRTEDLWEICLANVYVHPTAPGITQADITDTRQDGDVCGVATSLIQVDSAGLFAQYDAIWREWYVMAQCEMADWQQQRYDEFEEWLETVQDLLDDNAEANIAGALANLQQLVNTLSSERAGSVFEIGRIIGAIEASDWTENMDSGLFEAQILTGEMDVTDADVSIVIAPECLPASILGVGVTGEGYVAVFAQTPPEQQISYTLIANGRRE